mmetsp:Transcript_4167/g.4639  ORF Transcript_4167/g.4639 Transcript_4167/m.4639 type:complete len:417 (-) Transcript_4167:2291-3541(-)
MVELQPSSLEQLRKIADEFKCPAHPNKKLRGFCFTDKTFGCEECIENKPEDSKVEFFRSSKMAIALLDELVIDCLCDAHQSQIMFYCLEENFGKCPQCIAECCQPKKHEYEELPQLHKKMVPEVESFFEKLQNLIPAFQKYEDIDISRAKDLYQPQLLTLDEIISEIQTNRRKFYFGIDASPQDLIPYFRRENRSLYKSTQLHSWFLMSLISKIDHASMNSTFLSPTGQIVSKFPLGSQRDLENLIQVVQSHGAVSEETKAVIITALKSQWKMDNPVQEISFKNLGLDDRGVKVIGDGLKRNLSIRTVKISYKCITADGANDVAEMLRVNQAVETLSFRGKKLGPKGAKWIADALKINHIVTRLDFSDNSIDVKGADYMAEALEVNQDIIDLNLSCEVVSAIKISVKSTVAFTSQF